MVREKKIWKNYYDIVILPPKDLADYARRLSAQFPKNKIKWRLGKKTFLPHVSLYHIPVRPEKLEEFIRVIERIVKSIGPGTLQTTTTERELLLMLSKPDWLKKLYLKVVKNALPYFDWSYEVEKYWNINRLPPRMRKTGIRFLRKYGTPMIGLNYRPHITLTMLKDGPPQKYSVSKVKYFKFRPKSLFICELGPSHSCQRIVKEINFK